MSRVKNKIDTCEVCKKEFLHFSWDKQRYCSRECSNNRVKVTVNCIVCNKEIKKSNSLVTRNTHNYCSRDCYNLRNNGHKRLKRSTAYYQELLNKSSCDCGENKSYLLQIHHIDGDHNNNSEDNIEIVCPTCHVKRHLKMNSSGNWIYNPKFLTDRSLLNSL